MNSAIAPNVPRLQWASGLAICSASSASVTTESDIWLLPCGCPGHDGNAVAFPANDRGLAGRLRRDRLANRGADAVDGARNGKRDELSPQVSSVDPWFAIRPANQPRPADQSLLGPGSGHQRNSLVA